MEGQGWIAYSPPDLVVDSLLFVAVIIEYRQREQQGAEVLRLSSVCEKHTKMTIHKDYKPLSLDVDHQFY